MTPAPRLVEILRQAAERLRFPCPPDVVALADDPDTEVIPCGQGAVSFTVRPWGVVYLNAGFPPGDLLGYRQAYRAIQQGLARYQTLHAVVHPRNLPSARLVVRLGGVPIGLDPEGFIHYELVHGRNPHAQPTETAGSHPAVQRPD